MVCVWVCICMVELGCVDVQYVGGVNFGVICCSGVLCVLLYEQGERMNRVEVAEPIGELKETDLD